MRLEERCPCGGMIVLGYETGRSYGTSQLDRSEAHKQLDNFRRRHKACLNGAGNTATSERPPGGTPTAA